MTGAAARTIMTAMEAADSPPKQRLSHPKTLLAIVGGVALGAVAAAAWWRVMVVPAETLAHKRYQSTMDIVTMYGLQLSYKRAKGTYANDLASLLSVDPDAAALKASLAANVDMNTLTVIGDADKFRIELNVLDPDRTLIKIKGPIPPRAPAAAPPVLRTQAPPMNADGAPISPGR